MTKSIINTLNNPEQFLPPMPINPEIIEKHVYAERKGIFRK